MTAEGFLNSSIRSGATFILGLSISLSSTNLILIFSISSSFSEKSVSCSSLLKDPDKPSDREVQVASISSQTETFQQFFQVIFENNLEGISKHHNTIDHNMLVDIPLGYVP